MKTILFVTVSLLSAWSGIACAQDDKAAEAPETAWSKDSELMAGGPYVYGWVPVPPDILRRLVPGLEGDDADEDPFNTTPDNPVAYYHNLGKWASVIPSDQIPRCLPKLSQYRDLRKLMLHNGVALTKKGWVLLPSGLENHNRLYFCASTTNAGIIANLFTFCTRHPRNVSQLVTLVSTENQKLSNSAWTVKNLKKLNPSVHARFGIHSRSGERASVIVSPQAGVRSEYGLEPVVGENNFTMDCRFAISCALTENDRSALTITQQTAFTTNSNSPFVINCGTHGLNSRNYFLIIHSNVTPLATDHSHSEFQSLKKIEGQYAMCPPSATKAPEKINLTTSSYRADPRFLEELREQLELDEPEGDPFADNIHFIPEPPVRISGLGANQHHAATDKVFNITPQFTKLGLATREGEWVYYNHTRKHIIAHGSPPFHSQVVSLANLLASQIYQVSISAHIISVDRAGTTAPDWSLEKIKQANPIYLKKYATTARSGEKSGSGHFTTRKNKNKETGKTETINEYEFEVEPVIVDQGKYIDLRYTIRSQPLGKSKLSMHIGSTISLEDGEPAIIEIGHPNKNNRTHLLVLTADITSVDGLFIRDRFKPIIPEAP